MVTDRDSFPPPGASPARKGILLGGSGGSAVHAALEVARKRDDSDALVVVLLPDSGRGYLSKLYNDDWMRENGFLSRFRQPVRVGAVVAERSGETPTVVAIGCDQTVSEAIELLRQHDISQLPVVRTGTSIDGASGGSVRVEVQSVAGSVQERGLLDHLFRNPESLNAKVSTVMDGPFPLVDANEEVERVVPMLASGAPAVLVQRDGTIIGVITRADVLEYVAHHRLT